MKKLHYLKSAIALYEANIPSPAEYYKMISPLES